MTAYARTQQGLGSVTNNGSLMDAANAKVQDMLACGYSHTACGHPFDYWFTSKGYAGKCTAENIAQEVLPVTHQYSVSDMIQAGQDIERRVLLKATTAFLQHRIILHNQRTIVFR